MLRIRVVELMGTPIFGVVSFSDEFLPMGIRMRVQKDLSEDDFRQLDKYMNAGSLRQEESKSDDSK